MRHEVQVRKGGAKVCTINICLPCTLWEKQAVAPRAKDIDSIISRQVRQPDRKDRLALAENMRAPPKSCCSILFVHNMHAPVGHNVAGDIV
jgi:hypothetical protein